MVAFLPPIIFSRMVGEQGASPAPRAGKPEPDSSLAQVSRLCSSLPSPLWPRPKLLSTPWWHALTTAMAMGELETLLSLRSMIGGVTTSPREWLLWLRKDEMFSKKMKGRKGTDFSTCPLYPGVKITPCCNFKQQFPSVPTDSVHLF